MVVVRIVFGILLCILGIHSVVFQLGMLYSEPHAFASGWHIFLIFIIVGIIIFVGGVLLLVSG